MLKYFQYISIILVFASLNSQLLCQNYFVSNLYNNLVFSNPSTASFNNFSILQINYRNQWPIANMYNTYGIAYFHNAENLNSNFGFIINHDRQYNAAITASSAGINYSYLLKTGYRTKILFGINGNYIFLQENYSQLTFENPASVALENRQQNIPVFNAGISFVFGREHLIGFSVTDIIDQLHTSYLSREYHLNYIGKIDTRRRGLPPMIFEPIGEITLKDNFLLTSYGCNIEFSTIKTGALISQSNINFNTITFLLGILFDKYEFVYTYDLNLSGAISINPKMAAHEVTFLSKFQYKGKSKKHGAIKCPKF